MQEVRHTKCSPLLTLQALTIPNPFFAGTGAADKSPHKISCSGRDRCQRRRLQRDHVRLHRAAVDRAQTEQEQVGGHNPRLERRRHPVQQV